MILINPDSNRKQKLGGFSRYVPLSVPIGIGYLAAYLGSRKKNVRIIDEEIAPLSVGLLAEYTRQMQEPYIFGLSCLTAGIGRGIEVARLLKDRFPQSKVIFGSIHPTVLPDEVLRENAVDIVVRGEAEETLGVLYERLKARQGYSDIKGISFRENGRVIHNENANLPDLENIPQFPYQLFRSFSPRYELGFVASSRGCPYDCIFCSQRSISGRRYRFFSASSVIASLDELINKYGRNYITFVDDSFLMNRQRVQELCEAIKQRGFQKKAIFDCQARGETVDEKILENLKSAGFRTIHFGIETASERLMKLIDKRETVGQIKDAVRLAKRVGFQVSGTFILGLPGETKQERRLAFLLTKDLALDYVRFNNATPYPGTRLYEIAKQENRLNPGINWQNLNACGTLVASPFKQSPLAYVPLNVTERELKYDILKYNLFYSFRPGSIYKILKERIGPAGWLTLPQNWYLRPNEWIYLLRFGFGVFCAFLKVFFYNIAGFFKS